MRVVTAASACFIILGFSAALGQNVNAQSSKYSTVMEVRGAELTNQRSHSITKLSFDDLQGFDSGAPTNLLSKIAQARISEMAGTVRSAKDAQIYRAISPSVVLIATKEGLGSGSLV